MIRCDVVVDMQTAVVETEVPDTRMIRDRIVHMNVRWRWLFGKVPP